MHYQNMTEPCFFLSKAKQCLKRKCIVCGGYLPYAHLIPCWKLWLNMVYKSGRKTNFRKEEKLLMAALRRVFPDAKNKVFYTKRFQNSTLKIKTVSNGKWIRSKDAGRGWNSNSRKNTICKVVKQEKLVEEKLLVILKLFAGKKQMSRKRTEKKDSQEYRSNFRTLPQSENSLLIYVRFSGNDKECSFFVSR